MDPIDGRQTTLTLRPALEADEAAVRRLAQRDCAKPPERPWMLAETNGQLLAAGSLIDGALVADPFVPSAHAARMLSQHMRSYAKDSPTGQPPSREVRSERRLRSLRQRFAS